MTSARPITIAAVLGASLVGCLAASAQSPSAIPAAFEQSRRLMQFTEAKGNVDNPERGFSWAIDLFKDDGYARVRDRHGVTLVRVLGRLDAWRTSDIPEEQLAIIDQRMATARAAGLKLILRFSYNEGPRPIAEPDASLDWIKRHIVQLKPYLHKHGDVIAWMEAGFIGAWGEWHAPPMASIAIRQAKREVARRTAGRRAANAQRAAAHVQSDLAVLAEGPGSAAAGLGAARRCHGSATTTTASSPPRRIPAPMVADGARRARQGDGCRLRQVHADRRRDVPRQSSRARAARPHCRNSPCWASASSTSASPGVLDGWRAGGCFETIRSRLGHRLVIDEIALPEKVVRGADALVTLKIRNTGFAAPVNARPVWLVLDGPVRRYFSLPYDPRKWLPGKTHVVEAVAVIPSNLPAGRYSLSLWLPDEAEALQRNPRYAIRLANEGLWNPSSGLNRLVGDLVIQ